MEHEKSFIISGPGSCHLSAATSEPSMKIRMKRSMLWSYFESGVGAVGRKWLQVNQSFFCNDKVSWRIDEFDKKNGIDI